MNKKIRWSQEKSNWLRNLNNRGRIGFEECAILIEQEDILDIIQNPSKNFPDQKAYILNVDGYIYCVPFVEDDEEIFLKTLYPSRKLKAFYLDKQK